MKNTLSIRLRVLILFGECPFFDFNEFLNDPEYKHGSEWELVGGFTRLPQTKAYEEIKKWTDVTIVPGKTGFFGAVDDKVPLLMAPDSFLIIGVNEEIPEFFYRKYRGKIVSDRWKFF